MNHNLLKLAETKLPQLIAEPSRAESFWVDSTRGYDPKSDRAHVDVAIRYIEDGLATGYYVKSIDAVTIDGEYFPATEVMILRMDPQYLATHEMDVVQQVLQNFADTLAA